jgi:hypothetical protein
VDSLALVLDSVEVSVQSLVKLLLVDNSMASELSLDSMASVLDLSVQLLLLRLLLVGLDSVEDSVQLLVKLLLVDNSMASVQLSVDSMASVLDSLVQLLLSFVCC